MKRKELAYPGPSSKRKLATASQISPVDAKDASAGSPQSEATKLQPPAEWEVSVLLWNDNPVELQAGGKFDEHVGIYVTPNRQTARFLLRGWNEARAVFEYGQTKGHLQFDYNKRIAWTGRSSGDTFEGGSVIGHEVSPILSLHLPDEEPWPEVLKNPENDGTYI